MNQQQTIAPTASANPVPPAEPGMVPVMTINGLMYIPSPVVVLPEPVIKLLAWLLDDVFD